MLYGGIYVGTAWLVLTGLVAAGTEYNRPVMLGHAMLWEPLFFSWELALVVSLILTQRRAHSTEELS